MPHYSDGTEAKVGDLVFGVTHSSKTPVAGYVVSIQPAATSCNMYVAALRPVKDLSALWGACFAFNSNGRSFHATATAEIANCDSFSLLHRVEATAAEPAP
jgi:hypothetical protein